MGINLANMKFSRLTAIEYIGKSKWMWKCDCGNTKVIHGYDVSHGRVSSCGCLRKEVARNINLKPVGESAFTNIYCTYRQSASNRGLEFDLSMEFVKDIINKPCHYCGILPLQEQKNRFNNGSYFYNGIDRINPDFGYLVDNVVPCCWTCNEKKKSMGYDQFLSWIKKVYENLQLNLVT
jgi:hypothetical protein